MNTPTVKEIVAKMNAAGDMVLDIFEKTPNGATDGMVLYSVKEMLLVFVSDRGVAYAKIVSVEKLYETIDKIHARLANGATLLN